jgi:apolipoprotein N-acyltransferase
MRAPTLPAEMPAVRGAHPIVAAVASAFLLWCAFPPTDSGWLAWIALAPLFALVKSARSRLTLYTSAWAGGLVFWLLAIQWVRLTDESAWLAWVVMALTLSFWWPGFLALTRLAVLRLRLPLMLAAPIIWTGLEYLRAHFLTGFPWYNLAHSQHRFLPVIQVADLTGSLGISLLIALVNAWWVELFTTPLLAPTSRGPRPTRAQIRRALVVGLALTATLGYGAFRLTTARFRPGPRVALIQSNFLQRYKMTADYDAILESYRVLIDRAVAASPRPDLIVWPETAYPYGFILLDPTLDAATIAEQVHQINPELQPSGWIEKQQRIAQHLHGWTDALGIPMLVGTLTYDHRRAGLSKYNSAVLFEPGVKTPQTYNKLHLVPFGEYVPLVETFPWLVALTPYHGSRVPSLTFGHEPAWFTLGPYRLATAICFEDTVPHVTRRFFSEAKDGHQPDLLINISNDGWFQGSEELDMHLAVSIFRAIENRVPLARAANTGISALIDGNGRVVASLAKMRAGVVSETVPLDDRRSAYSRLGDWVGLTCLAATIGLPFVAFTGSALRRRSA